MLSLYYQGLEFADVTDLNDFYRETLPEVQKVKSLISTARLVYSLPPNRVLLQLGQGDRVYKILLLDNKKRFFGWFVYMPLQKRLDLFSIDMPDVPLIQWQNRKTVTMNYNQLFVLSKIDKVFDRFTSIL